MKITKALIKIFRHPTARVLVGLLVVSISVFAFVRVKYQADTNPTNWYVATNGSAIASGDIDHPIDLQTALSGFSGKIKPGDTINLRGGTYSGAFSSSLTGTSGARITVKSYPGEWAKIDGYFATTLAAPMDGISHYCQFVGGPIFGTSTDNNGFFTIEGERLGLWGWFPDKYAYYYTPSRVHPAGTTVEGSGPALKILGGDWTDYRDFEVTDSVLPSAAADGVGVFSPHTRLINMVVHDVSLNGIGFWSTAVDSEVYGCLIYHNNLSGMGHGIYTQNDTGIKHISDNIIFNQQKWGIHAYSENGSVNNYLVEGNVVFHNALAGGNGNVLFGGRTYSTGMVFKDNYTWGPLVWFGWRNDKHDIVATGNYIAGRVGRPLYVNQWQQAQFRNNTVIGTYQLVDLALPTADQQTYDWDYNEYHSVGVSDWNRFVCPDQAVCNFVDWKTQTGVDANSTMSTSWPTGAHVVVRPNEFEAGRANIAVYNWDKTATVNVDVSTAVAIGATYAVKNAEDYFGPSVASGTYNGGTISLPMSGGASSPDFDAFVITSFDTPAPPPAPDVSGSNDTSVYSVSSYQKSLTISGSKASNTKAYYRGTLLADLDTTSWTLTFTPDAGHTTDPIEYKDADGNIIATKPVSISVHKSADINGDNHVNLLDLSLLANSWGAHDPPNTFTDLNSDGDVNLLDLSIMASRWEG